MTGYHRNRRAFERGQFIWDNACPPDDEEDQTFCNECSTEQECAVFGCGCGNDAETDAEVK